MKILFGVFELGLGHATRCTPLIEILLSKKHEVHIISTGRSLNILKETFKEKCVYYDICGIHSFYNSNFFKTNFAIHINSIIKSLKKARVESKLVIDKGKFDLVISDCRYDIFDKVENSFLINHQLRLMAPIGCEMIIEKYLNSMMNNYSKIIVPDFETSSLSGRLSHGLRYIAKDKIDYIGILSSVKKLNLKEDVDIFISLSGPEKTRLKLEKKIISQALNLNEKVVITGGNPDKHETKKFENITYYSYLKTKEQQNLMNRAKFLVIRSGYTTIMELAELNKKALLIPSPGQTEQEYLGDYLEEKKYFHHISQSKINLIKDIKVARKLDGFVPPWTTNESVKKFIKAIS
ncbi:MAG: glycosyltransferase family protein [Candidatus Pacearchaeota archaeon]|jgi:uncharacterized protein (TIGR00661 family)